MNSPKRLQLLAVKRNIIMPKENYINLNGIKKFNFATKKLLNEFIIEM